MNRETKKEIENILENLLNIIEKTRVQMYDRRDLVGNHKVQLYANDKVEVLYAPEFEYVEILGLSDEDYNYFFKRYGY